MSILKRKERDANLVVHKSQRNWYSYSCQSIEIVAIAELKIRITVAYDCVAQSLPLSEINVNFFKHYGQ
uniref:Uncharacterized protein n=1 Tax=Pararge aegeria TaxID=116150 RepID=S4P8V8_9NEOP